MIHRGEENSFKMPSRNLGKLVKCYIGLVENDNVQTTTKDNSWHCSRVIVTNTDTGDRCAFFSSGVAIQIASDILLLVCELLRIDGCRAAPVNNVIDIR